MNYKQTLDYLYKALPMFHRVGAAAYKPDLGNTVELCRLAGNPHLYIKCIHVAGTNGKGSVSNMLASVLQEAGFKTGLYTSPHLKDFRERIRIDGKMISSQYIVDFVQKYKKQFEDIQPSFFEMTVALAFSYFKDKKVDVAVIETGLGGRLDSTNIIVPELSVITNVGWDHMNLLGNSLQEIAREKAGIIKQNVPAVLGEEDKNTVAIFKRTAAERNAPLFIASRNYKIAVRKHGVSKLDLTVKNKSSNVELTLDLAGGYQIKNVATVMQSLELITNQFSISDVAVKRGLRNIRKNTGFAGRWHLLSRSPMIIADTGHNIDGIKEVLRMFRKIKFRHLHFVIGMVNDKAIDEILKLLPTDAVYYFCKADIPRGLDAFLLKESATKFGLNGNIYKSVRKALNAAKRNASAKDLIFVGGSTFTVAEII